MERKGKQGMDLARTVTLNLSFERENADLSYDIIYQIMLRLPIEDILRCKSVCKTWYELTRESHFISFQMSKALCQPSRVILAPLLYSCYENYRNSLFLIGEEKCSEIPINHLKLTDYIVTGSCNGLLFIASIYKSDHPAFIYNPSTREYKELPNIDFCTDEVLFGFGFDRIHKKYKVICVYRSYYGDIDYEGSDTEAAVTTGAIITEGESSWRKLEFPYQVCCEYVSETIFLDGAFHWMIDWEHSTSGSEASERILALDVSSEKFHTISFPLSTELHNYWFLIEFAGHLALTNDYTTLGNLSQIWQIVASESNGWSISRYCCKHQSETNVLKYFLRVLNWSSDERSDYCGCCGYSARDCLQENQQSREVDTSDSSALYVPENDQPFISEMHRIRIPRSFSMVFFTPTLVSTREINFSPEPMRGRGIDLYRRRRNASPVL